MIRAVVATPVVCHGRGRRVDTGHATPRSYAPSQGTGQFARTATDIDSIVSWARTTRPDQFGEQSPMPTEEPHCGEQVVAAHTRDDQSSTRIIDEHGCAGR
ncbi:hypothetical protein GCM10011588_20020 [Nocardia jinanensis]|uniref:Uncharacterized protein n=1 Tax=Nocardia jinanensis TaxID=382504 RepID=A0A917RFK5_9NOCA|nr:hypothetical protein GCM10011588_20020 [Nocardia jinanensis]